MKSEKKTGKIGRIRFIQVDGPGLNAIQFGVAVTLSATRPRVQIPAPRRRRRQIMITADKAARRAVRAPIRGAAPV